MNRMILIVLDGQKLPPLILSKLLCVADEVTGASDVAPLRRRDFPVSLADIFMELPVLIELPVCVNAPGTHPGTSGYPLRAEALKHTPVRSQTTGNPPRYLLAPRRN